MFEGIPIGMEALAVKDFALGFFAGIALKRGRIKAILDRWLPTES